MNPAAVIIALSLVLTVSGAAPDTVQPDLYSKTHVTVADNIPAEAISVHCFSGDDDLGTHQLSYLEFFAWNFRYNLVGDTKFFCTIHTQYGSGSYKVYGRDIMLDRCGLKCVWQVDPNGPCLQQTRGGLWCLPWQTHP